MGFTVEKFRGTDLQGTEQVRNVLDEPELGIIIISPHLRQS